jgi:ATP-dependent DNA helicase PIF1
MVYGLYGSLKPRVICMKKAYANALFTYFKRFPKPFANKTIVNSDSYPKYRRRRTVDGVNVQWSDEGIYDNRWIVPYNLYLIRRYKAYINVEICITVQAIKYIYKYVYKERDKAILEIANTDKIKRYIICRYIGLSQAIWGLLKFFIYKEYFTIVRLPLYLLYE